MLSIGPAATQPPPPALSARQQGMSLVELMVATAIGLFIMVGSISLFITNLGNMRRLNVEARINQDMRATMELITRDLRRAGYWANSVSGTIATGTNNVTTSNVYAAVTPGAYVSGTSNATKIAYNFARDANDVLNNEEQFGFQLNLGVIEMQTSTTSGWQPITDGDLINISTFTITPVETRLPVGDICMKPCAAGSVSPEGTACPTLTVREYNVLLRGSSKTDTKVTRELRSSVRVRNDQFSGVCPL